MKSAGRVNRAGAFLVRSALPFGKLCGTVARRRVSRFGDRLSRSDAAAGLRIGFGCELILPPLSTTREDASWRFSPAPAVHGDLDGPVGVNCCFTATVWRVRRTLLRGGSGGLARLKGGDHFGLEGAWTGGQGGQSHTIPAPRYFAAREEERFGAECRDDLDNVGADQNAVAA